MTPEMLILKKLDELHALSLEMLDKIHKQDRELVTLKTKIAIYGTIAGFGSSLVMFAIDILVRS